MSITKAIADKLNSIFPHIPIYIENIDYETDDLKEPSFFIQRVSMSIVPRLFEIQKRIYRYHIVYFPKSNSSREDLEDISEQLAWEIQEIDNIARMSDRNIEILESAAPFLELHFSFSLEVHFMATEGSRFNNDLDYKGGLKDG